MIEKLPKDCFVGMDMQRKLNEIIDVVNRLEGENVLDLLKKEHKSEDEGHQIAYVQEHCDHKWEWSRNCDEYGRLLEYCSLCGKEKVE